MADYSKYKESAFTHEEMQPMIVESDMTDVFDDLAKAFKAGHDAGRSEAADEIERLREALREIKGLGFNDHASKAIHIAFTALEGGKG